MAFLELFAFVKMRSIPQRNLQRKKKESIVSGARPCRG